MPQQARPLPHHRQRELVRRAQRGDLVARHRLAETNQAFVRQTAAAFLGRGVEFEELVQEGNLGLLHAIDKFDLNQPVNFMTYAAYWIRQAMGRACERQGTLQRYQMRLPAHVSHAMGKVAKQRSRFEQQLGRPATTEELAEACELSPQLAEQACRLLDAGHPLKPSEEEDYEQMMSQLPDPNAEVFDQTAQVEQLQVLEDMMRSLPEDERELLRRRFGLGTKAQSERSIAREWGVPRSRLQALRARALERLRKDHRLMQLAADRIPRRDLAVCLAEQSCGHLREGFSLDELQLEAELRIADRVAAGRWGGAWWMISKPSGSDRFRLRLSDGPEGELFELPEAIRCFQGEQRIEAAELAALLPLQAAETCSSCQHRRLNR